MDLPSLCLLGSCAAPYCSLCSLSCFASRYSICLLVYIRSMHVALTLHYIYPKHLHFWFRGSLKIKGRKPPQTRYRLRGPTSGQVGVEYSTSANVLYKQKSSYFSFYDLAVRLWLNLDQTQFHRHLIILPLVCLVILTLDLHNCKSQVDYTGPNRSTFNTIHFPGSPQLPSALMS